MTFDISAPILSKLACFCLFVDAKMEERKQHCNTIFFSRRVKMQLTKDCVVYREESVNSKVENKMLSIRAIKLSRRRRVFGIKRKRVIFLQDNNGKETITHCLGSFPLHQMKILR